MRVAQNDSDERAELRGYVQFNKYTYIHTYSTVYNNSNNYTYKTAHIQPEHGDEQADAGRDCRTRLARPNSQARTRAGKYSFSLFS